LCGGLSILDCSEPIEKRRIQTGKRDCRRDGGMGGGEIARQSFAIMNFP